jgi:hypothetical protein
MKRKRSEKAEGKKGQLLMLKGEKLKEARKCKEKIGKLPNGN